MPIYVPPLIALAGGLMLAMLPLRNRKSVCTLTELFMLATAVCTGFCLTGPDTVLKLLTVSDGLELYRIQAPPENPRPLPEPDLCRTHFLSLAAGEPVCL